MLLGGYNLCVEQSEHIFFLKYSTTEDGMLSAVQLINIMKETGKKLSELANELSIYPQILKNIRVNDKNRALNNMKILDEIYRVKQDLGESVRVLVIVYEI